MRDCENGNIELQSVQPTKRTAEMIILLYQILTSVLV
jgi:hypothetical protein